MPKTPPNEDLIVSIESAIKGSEYEKKASIRHDLSNHLKTHNNNFFKKNREWKIIDKLKEKNCVFIEPDKGKGPVIMDKEEYIQAAENHLAGEIYEEVKVKSKFPVDVLQKDVKEQLDILVKKKVMDKYGRLSLIVPNPRIPNFSCLPKTHKEGNKVRPVVSSINSPTSRICDWLVKRFRAFEKPASLSTKNSFELADNVQNWKLRDDERLVSFDVEALFPSIPVQEAYDLCAEWIESQNISDDKAMKCTKLVKLVLDQRWLQFGEKIYRQKDGLFIGNSLSPILTEIFMGNLEMSMKTKEWFPRIWHRYVDDVIAVVNVGEELKILEQLNKQHESIKFTMELEHQNSIPFLDMRLSREGNSVEVNIYRKPTDAPQCIPWDSCHHPAHKFAAFESAIHRMFRFPLSEENREKR